MSTKDAKLSYAILAIAIVAVLALVTIYSGSPGDTTFTENALRKGTPPPGARSAAPREAQGIRAAQSITALGQATSQSHLTRTAKVQFHASTPTAHGGSGPGLTRSATTQAAQAAKAHAKSAAGQTGSVDRTRSAGPQKTQAANPAARSASVSNGARSAPTQSARAAKPSAGAGASANLTRAASAQSAQAARPQASSSPSSAQSLSRSATAQATKPNGRSTARDPARAAPMQVTQALAQPTASQAFGRSLSRSAPAQAAQAAILQAARLGDPNGEHRFVRSVPTQAAQGAPADRDTLALTRTLPSEVSRAAQAPLALQRKWDPARTLEAAPDEDVQEL